MPPVRMVRSFAMVAWSVAVCRGAKGVAYVSAGIREDCLEKRKRLATRGGAVLA